MKHKQCEECENLCYDIPISVVEKDIETGGRNSCMFREVCEIKDGVPMFFI